MTYHKTCVAHLFCIFCIHLSAQVSPGQWILQALQDSAYLHANSLSSYRAQHPLTIKWLDKIELRTETNDWNFNHQEYGVRLYGNDAAEMKYRKNLESIDYAYYQAQEADVLHEAILKRYRILLEARSITQQKELLTLQKLFYEKKATYLEALFKNELTTEIKDLIHAQRKIIRLKSAESGLADKFSLLMQECKRIGPACPDTSGFDWIKPKEILSLVLIGEPRLPITSAAARRTLLLAKTNLRRQELNDTRWSVLDFIQARWRKNNNSDLFREKFSIGAGFILPYKGDRQKSKNELALTSIETQYELDELNQDFRLKTEKIKNELVVLIEQWQKEIIQLQAFQSKYDPGVLGKNPAVDPKDILFVDETILDWQGELLDVQEKIFNRYLEYLDQTRLISQSPLKNYFHAMLEPIQ